MCPLPTHTVRTRCVWGAAPPAAAACGGEASYPRRQRVKEYGGTRSADAHTSGRHPNRPPHTPALSGSSAGTHTTPRATQRRSLAADTAAALAVVIAPAAAQTGRLAVSPLGCRTTGAAADEQIAPLPLHPTQLRIEGAALPLHMGCIVGNAVVAAAVALLHGAVVAALRPPCGGGGGAAAAARWPQGAAVAAAWRRDPQRHHGIGLRRVAGGAASRACARALLADGEWLSLPEGSLPPGVPAGAVERWGAVFRPALPGRHHL
eukprot:gene17533-42002_t